MGYPPGVTIASIPEYHGPECDSCHERYAGYDCAICGDHLCEDCIRHCQFCDNVTCGDCGGLVPEPGCSDGMVWRCHDSSS